VDETTWRVVDTLTASKPKKGAFCLRWLLRDFPVEFDPQGLSLALGSETLRLKVGSESSLTRWAVRAGELIHGEGQVLETDGWISPTYSVREAAIQYCILASERLPVQFITTIQFLPAGKAG